MTKDDVIRMAREAGLFVRKELPPEFIAFAALVAAAEREACVKVCDDKAKETFSGQCQTWGDYFARAIRMRGD